ncbi:MAG: hypothetical protein J6B04_03600 [Clostridia bacterium]|nr:hypothetical protein [Clostridia bacterium]
MKAKLFLTTALLSVVFTASGTVAFAETSAPETAYPENFVADKTFTTLNDFAVSGEQFAFADGYNVYVYENGVINSPNGQLSHSVQNIEFDKDALIFKDTANVYYSFAEGEITQIEEYDFSTPSSLDVDNYHYYLLDGVWEVYDKIEKTATVLSEYRSLKKYDGVVYAIKDNAFYRFSGASAEKVPLTFNDFSATKTVSVGNSAELLSTFSNCELVRISGEAFATQIDLNDLSGPYFKAVKTQKVADGTLALKLCQTGNATIVAFDNKAYITLTSYTSAVDFTPIAPDKQEGRLTQTVSVYSTPYICESTKLATLQLGTKVKILKTVSSEILPCEYYLVEYGESGETGYVATAFITEYQFSDNDDYTEIKGEQTFDNQVEEVIIVLIIILLVCATIAYLFHAGSAKSKKKNRTKKEDLTTE